jgi:hypothetical protein
MIRTETSGTPEAWRLAVGLVAAAMDGDQEAFDLLLEDVPEPALQGVVADLATMVTRVWLAAAKTPADARGALKIFALEVAAEVSP